MNTGTHAQQRLACLGDASRFRLVVALAAGERCVTELATAVGLSQSCTTRHLQTLDAAGLVRRIRYGKRVMIGLRRDEPELQPLFDWALALAERGERVPSVATRRTTPRARVPASEAARPGRKRAKAPVVRPARPTLAPRSAPAPANLAPAPADTEAEPIRRRSEPLEDFLL